MVSSGAAVVVTTVVFALDRVLPKFGRFRVEFDLFGTVKAKMLSIDTQSSIKYVVHKPII